MSEDLKPTDIPQPEPLNVMLPDGDSEPYERVGESKTTIYNAFPTPVLGRLWGNTAELNSRLTTELWKNRAHNPDGIYRSNAAGTWHSDDKILRSTGQAGEKLANMFFKQFSAMADQLGGQEGGKYEMSMQAWAMMYAEGGYATVHTHPNCHFSGVYYVNGGGADQATMMATGVNVKPGTLEFVNTNGGNRQIAGLNMNPAFRVEPRAGLMLIFPSWLPHFVHPAATDNRISIACNATMLRYTAPSKDDPNDPDE